MLISRVPYKRAAYFAYHRMTSRSTNDTTSAEAKAHEAATWKPATGFEWKKITRPEGWYKEDYCWCGEPWCDGHEDGDHDDVWQEVRIPTVLGKRKAGEGGSAASPIDCDAEEAEDEEEEAEESESEEESEEELPEGYHKGFYGPVRSDEHAC